MPSYIIKDEPDQDWYVMWSTVVDAPTFYGTRAEMEQCGWFGPGDVAAERFARADKYGTSAQWGADRPGAEIVRPYGWRDAGFVHQQGWLRRSRLRELCARLDREEPIDDLLEPTLTAWLLEQIEEDERALSVRYAADEHWWLPEAAYPERLRAECAAKRAIVELHGELFNTYNVGPVCMTCWTEDNGATGPGVYPCATIRALASVYADRPGWQEECS